MYILSIILFFAYTWSFGFGFSLLARESEDFLERNIMRIGIGLGSVITFGLLLNLLRIPIDWRIYLFVAILLVCLRAYIRYKKEANVLKIPKFSINLFSAIVLVLFFMSFYMYAKGAFSYPYLEDDDSWSHALGVKYIAVEKTAFEKTAFGFHYTDPYPPAYDMLLGIMHQTNDSVYWTLKFFNALLVSLSIIFFYFFARALTNSPRTALFAAFAMFSMPAHLSHFIWAISITMPLFFVSFYSIEKVKDDKRWWIISAVAIAATVTSSPSHSAYFGIFLVIYLAAKVLTERKFLIYWLAAALVGFLLSFILWWLPMIMKHGLGDTLSGLGLSGTTVLTTPGTGDRAYTMADFVFAKSVNMINNPIGIGFVLSLLVLAALVLLIGKYHEEFKKNKVMVLTVFFILSGILLFFLSQNYVKFVEKKDVQSLERGTVPFLEFLSDQRFMVFILLISLFVFTLLAIISYKKAEFREKHLIVVLLWFIFSFYAVNAGPFYYKLSPFRAWSLLAVPVSLLAGEGVSMIAGLARNLAGSFVKSGKILAFVSLAVIALVAYGVIITSFAQKYAVNTDERWPAGAFWTYVQDQSGNVHSPELEGYIWLKDNLPSGARIFTFSNNAVVVGMDKFTCHWCENVRVYQRSSFNQTAGQTYEWLKKEKYKYIVIDGQASKKFGANATNEKVREFANSGKFKPVFGNSGIVIFEVV